MKQKAKIPSPDKYSEHGSMISPRTLMMYTKDRSTYIDTLFAQSKKTPGIGKYDKYEYDEKRLKPVKGGTITNSKNVTYVDEVMDTSR